MPKRIATIMFFALFLILTSMAQTAVNFDVYFSDRTMRIDYFHTGTKGYEVISLDQVYEEPTVLTHHRQLWAGSKTNLLDTLNLGKYLVKVVDVRTNQIIFSHGYCSVFGEWETTDEAAKGIHRTFHESVLVPFPKQPIQVMIAKRDHQNRFRDIFSATIDPASRFVNRERHVAPLKVGSFIKSGDPGEKVDLVILGDGYTKNEMRKFRNDARHFIDLLFRTAPFNERKNAFNVWYIEAPSVDSGIDDPQKNQWRNTPFGCSYNSFDLPRYVLTFENKSIRDIASLVPYDQIFFLLNADQYGGGGIFNLYATCYASDMGAESNWWPDYVFVHEFGHAFAGLGDEYYTSTVAYNEFYPTDVDPWEPNVGIIKDSQIKWQSLMAQGTLITTPWEKSRYDSLAAALRNLDYSQDDYVIQREKIRSEMDQLLTSQKFTGKIGAFEGAGYSSKGLYRPFLNCRMFTKSLVDFCPVCRNGIEKVIDFYSK